MENFSIKQQEGGDNMNTQVCKCCGQELPIDSFPLRKDKRTTVCKDCAHQHNIDGRRAARERRAQERQDELADMEHKILNARNLRLCDFTPRELMAELHRRGYEGKLCFTQKTEVDISNMKQMTLLLIPDAPDYRIDCEAQTAYTMKHGVLRPMTTRTRYKYMKRTDKWA